MTESQKRSWMFTGLVALVWWLWPAPETSSTVHLRTHEGEWVPTITEEDIDAAVAAGVIGEYQAWMIRQARQGINDEPGRLEDAVARVLAFKKKTHPDWLP